MREHNKIVQKACIAWFSGTGGTKKAAVYFYQALTSRGVNVNIIEIDKEAIRKNHFGGSDTVDLFILLYPVYACNAPDLVEKWIEHMPAAKKVLSVVISVSGGGEISPNTASRVNAIKLLHQKGYFTTYEKMIVMPSNFVIATKKELGAELLRILPEKVDGIVNEVLSGKVYRTKPKTLDRVLTYIARIEKYGSKLFGRFIRVSESCNGCGLCVKKCPQRNIRLFHQKPVFQLNCILCLKCIYSCPKRALTPCFLKFIVLKDGFQLKDFEIKQELNPNLIESLTKGYQWSGIRKYLEET